MTFKLHKSVYIPSLEACDVHSHMQRDGKIKFKYIGMIPSSLELNKLVSMGLSITKPKNKASHNLISNDIINLKFKQKVKSGNEIIKKIENKISELDSNHSEYIEKLKSHSQEILCEIEAYPGKWDSLSIDELRNLLYTSGFTIKSVNPKTGEIAESKYVVYKRSSAKSRVGQCLFIKEHLHKEMIAWSRMHLELENEQVDFASLLAYESLVGSSLEDIIKINPKNILIVDDVDSKFKIDCNVVRTGENGSLDSFQENATLSNSLFDGESLLDSRYFNGESMKLLRNHMFKSAAFNCNLQLFLKDHCPPRVSFEKWKIKNMFGQSMFAKDVHLVITPSSLKALKFSHVLGSQKAMFDYWKGIVRDNDNLFGVCKSEKKSKLGVDNYGNILQQTSYQMLNSLPMTRDELKELIQFELDYINKLKNDDYFFIEHLKNTASDINSNEMFVALYNQNSEIVSTKLFRDFRKDEIKKQVIHIKNGKIRIPKSDYCVLLGNPIEFLLHSIGQFNVLETPLSLSGNEIRTSLLSYDKEVVGFRNPHTSPSNVLIAKNVSVPEIDKYFNLSANIVCVNAVRFPLQDILSGCDYDSDTICLFDNDSLLEIAKKCLYKYKVCQNQVSSSKRNYKISYKDMAEIDNQLSMSQKNIGRVVNLGQICMSTYWDTLSKDSDSPDLEELMKKIDVMTVLSGICIDLAKKLYDIDISNEIQNVAQTPSLKKEKPLFWEYVSQSNQVKTTSYDCPMDFLYREMSSLQYASYRSNVNLTDLLQKQNIQDGNRTQEKKIYDYVHEMCNKINNANKNFSDEEERMHVVDNIIKYYTFFVGKLTVKKETMYAIIFHMIKNNKSKISTRLLNILYQTQKDAFLSVFIAKT